jgi:hypothetical protein
VPVSNELDTSAGDLLDQLLGGPEESALADGPAFDLPAQAAEARASRGREDQHVVFGLAGNTYAIPIDSVREIGRPPAMTSVPNVPDWVLGLVNVRGDIVSLVDLRDFPGGAPPVGGGLRRRGR